MNRRIVILTTGNTSGPAKTATQIVRYCRNQVVAILDPAHTGKTSQQLLGLGGNIPVVASLAETSDANTLLIGIAPAGGKLPREMRQSILEAIRRKMTIISGLHQFLADDPEIAEAAQVHGAQLHDVRRNQERDVAHRKNINPDCLRIHTVGNDCNVGKMLVSMELTNALRHAGHDATFVATGQTGIMIAGDGCPIDAVVSDFISGAAERLVLKNQHHHIMLIEGQGSLVHPRYSAVTLGLLHGCIPHGLILCYEMGRNAVSDMKQCPIPPLKTVRHLYETMANVMHPCTLLGIAMNSRNFTEAEANTERDRVEEELGLPVADVLRHGPDKLVKAILSLRKK